MVIRVARGTHKAFGKDQFCRKDEVSAFTFFDVMDFFPSEPTPLAKIRFKTDTHWNRAGHAIAARAIVKTLLKNGVLAQSHLKLEARRTGGP